MLTKDDKKVVKALIILTSIALACIITSFILIIISKNYGFVGSSPITCSNNYFKMKFTEQNLFLSTSFSMIIISFLTSAVLLVQFIVLLIRMGRNRDANGNSLEDKIPTYYIIASIALLGIIITFGEYLAIFFQAVKECSYSKSIQLIIIVAASSLSFVIITIIWCILIYLAEKRPKEGLTLEKLQQKSQKIHSQKIQKQVKLQLQGKPSDKKLPLLQKQEIIQQKQQKPIQYNLNVHNAFRTQQLLPQQSRVSIPIRESDYIQPQFERKYSHSSQQREKSEPQKRETIIIKEQSRFLPQPQVAIPSTPTPPSQNVTHINFNFPNNFAQNPIPTISNQPENTKSNDTNNPKADKSHQKKKIFSRKQIIRQSAEQDRQSDSDDRFYKKGRKNNQKASRFQENRKRQSKYDRQYDKIDNKFEHTPLEPRYVVVSPDSMKKFYEFVSAEEYVEDTHPYKRNLNLNQNKNQKKNRGLPPSIPKSPQSKLSLSPQPHFEVTVVPKRQQKEQQQKNRDYMLSQVNEGFYHQQVSNHKDRSFYEQLQDKQSFRDDFKTYQRFFNSRAISQPQKLQFPSSFDDYFDILNSSTHIKDKHSGSQLQSNYSSILNQQYKGKIPTQRQSKHRKIRLEQNELKQAEAKKTQSFYNKIKQKYK